MLNTWWQTLRTMKCGVFLAGILLLWWNTTDWVIQKWNRCLRVQEAEESKIRPQDWICGPSSYVITWCHRAGEHVFKRDGGSKRACRESSVLTTGCSYCRGPPASLSRFLKSHLWILPQWQLDFSMCLEGSFKLLNTNNNTLRLYVIPG